MKILGIIPSRLDSSRFPNKPLADINGKPMIQWVYEAARQSKEVDEWIIASPDEELYVAAREFGAECIITSNLHKSGTDRCAEAILKVDGHYDAVINVQGDEPLIDSAQIDALAQSLTKETQIATLMRRSSDMELINSNSTAKVVYDASQNALYFSRSPIPFFREEEPFAYLHVGMYGYSVEVLKELSQISFGRWEKIEMLEQLRWLEHGFGIKCIETDIVNYGVDTPEDLETVKKIISENG